MAAFSAESDRMDRERMQEQEHRARAAIEREEGPALFNAFFASHTNLVQANARLAHKHNLAQQALQKKQAAQDKQATRATQEQIKNKTAETEHLRSKLARTQHALSDGQEQNKHLRQKVAEAEGKLVTAQIKLLPTEEPKMRATIAAAECEERDSLACQEVMARTYLPLAQEEQANRAGIQREEQVMRHALALHAVELEEQRKRSPIQNQWWSGVQRMFNPMRKSFCAAEGNIRRRLEAEEYTTRAAIAVHRQEEAEGIVALDEQRAKALFASITTNDKDAVRKMIRDYPALLECKLNGVSPLQYATQITRNNKRVGAAIAEDIAVTWLWRALPETDPTKERRMKAVPAMYSAVLFLICS